MAFHLDKYTQLSISQKKNTIIHDYILHDHNLESVSSAKYLGITLQSNLKWNKHIDNITLNGNKSLSFLNLKVANTEIKSKAHQALVRPKLEYNCSGWDPHTKDQPILAERRLKTRLVLFYKIVHCLVAIPSHILVPTDSRTRQNHLQTFRQIQTTKDTYKWSFFPNTIIQWNMLHPHYPTASENS